MKYWTNPNRRSKILLSKRVTERDVATYLLHVQQHIYYTSFWEQHICKSCSRCLSLLIPGVFTKSPSFRLLSTAMYFNVICYNYDNFYDYLDLQITKLIYFRAFILFLKSNYTAFEKTFLFFKNLNVYLHICCFIIFSASKKFFWSIFCPS